MALQTTVNKELAIGMEGEFYDDSPRRVTTYKGKKTDSANMKIGVAFTSVTAEDEAQVGGAGRFLGIAVNPKEYARYNNFNATMEIPDGVAVQLCTFGHILVKVAGDTTAGQVAFYSTTDGTIKGGTAGATVSGFVEIKNSSFQTSALSGKIAKLELGN